MSNPLPWTLVNGVLTVIMSDGESKTVQKASDFKRFDSVLQAIREERWDEVPDIICPKKHMASFSDGRIVVKDGKIYIDDKQVPSELSNRIIDYADQNLPYQALIAFWHNLNQNPSNRAVTRLYAFLEANKHPITPDGCFIAYRGVRSDFKDVHSGTMDNSPGNVVKMPRNEVDESDQTCSHGLHVANHEFGRSFGPVCLMVKVNPRDVVSVPTGYGTSKMRVCEFEVLQVVHEGSHEALHDDGSMLSGGGNYPQIPMADSAGQLNEYEEDEDDEEDEDEDEYYYDPYNGDHN
jgi:hypothetical protein